MLTSQKSQEFNSILTLIQRFPNEEAARDYFAEIRWGGQVGIRHPYQSSP